MGLCFSNFSYVCNVIYYFYFLFLLFIGLFSETCKCDILDGCLQPHGNCLSQFKAGPWGGSFAVPLLSTAAFAVFWAASLLQNQIHPFGKMHPSLILLPGVFSAQVFLGKIEFFLNPLGFLEKKKSQTQSHLALFQFLQNSAEKLSPALVLKFLPWGIWIFLGLGTLWADKAAEASLGLLALPPLQLPVLGFLNSSQHCQENVIKFCHWVLEFCKWPVCPVCLERAQIPHCSVPWPGWGFLCWGLALGGSWASQGCGEQPRAGGCSRAQNSEKTLLAKNSRFT